MPVTAIIVLVYWPGIYGTGTDYREGPLLYRRIHVYACTSTRGQMYGAEQTQKLSLLRTLIVLIAGGASGGSVLFFFFFAEETCMLVV